MSNEHNFLITYGLHNFVTHARADGKHVFTIHDQDNPKLAGHAKSLITGRYGASAVILIP